jgi:hypothetical protein
LHPKAVVRIKELTGGFDLAAEGAKIAAAAMQQSLSVAAAEIAADLGNMGGAAVEASEKIKGLFAGFELASTTRLGDVALALAEVASQSDKASRNVREGLAAELRKLSGEDLLKFSSASQAAFEEFGKSGVPSF